MAKVTLPDGTIIDTSDKQVDVNKPPTSNIDVQAQTDYAPSFREQAQQQEPLPQVPYVAPPPEQQTNDALTNVANKMQHEMKQAADESLDRLVPRLEKPNISGFTNTLDDKLGVETKDSFILDDGRKIAKALLSPERQQQIRAMLSNRTERMLDINKPGYPNLSEPIMQSALEGGTAGDIRPTSSISEFGEQRERLRKIGAEAKSISNIEQPQQEEWSPMEKPVEPAEPEINIPSFEDVASKEALEYKNLVEAQRTFMGPPSPDTIQKLKNTESSFLRSVKKHNDLVEAIQPALENYNKEKQQWRDQMRQYEENRKKGLETEPGIKYEIAQLDEQWSKMMKYQVESLSELQDKIELERKEIRSMKVQPGRVWRKNPAAAALMIVGAGLQGFGASMTGRGDPNAGVKAMFRLMENDIAIQQKEIANKRAGAKGIVNDLERKLRMFTSERAAMRVHRAEMIDSLRLKMDELKARTRDQMAAKQIDIQSKQLQLAAEREIGDSLKDEMKARADMVKAVNGEATEQKPLPGKAIDTVSKGITAINLISKMRKLWPKLTFKKELEGILPRESGPAKEFLQNAKLLTIQITNKLSGLAFTDGQIKYMASMVPNFFLQGVTEDDSTFKPTLGDSKENGMMKLNALLDYLATELEVFIDTSETSPAHEKQARLLREQFNKAIPEGYKTFSQRESEEKQNKKLIDAREEFRKRIGFK